MEANEDIRATVTPLSSEGSEQDVAFVLGNGGLKRIDSRSVKDRAKIFCLLVFATIEFRAKDVVLAGFARTGEINIAIGGDRRKNLAALAVHGSGNALRLLPAAGRSLRSPNGPAVQVFSVYGAI